MPLKEIIIALFRLKKEKATAFFSIKLKGGALYISIMVSIIMGIILCMFILIGNYNQRSLTVYTQSSQLYYNLLSAYEIAQSGYFTEAQNNIWIKNTVNDDSIKINKRAWGAYLLISAQTKNRHQLLSQSGLYGASMSADTGLLVTNTSRPLGLSGKVSFKANCYLPDAGITPAYIEGQSYSSSPQNSSFIRKAPVKIPELQQAFIDGISRQQSSLYGINDSIIALPQGELKQAFTLKTLVYETTASRLSHLLLKDNIKIIAGNVEIDSSCKLNNILLICKKVRFKEGFKGKIHVIASDSIITEKKCEFDFPSSFVLLPEDNSNELRYIQLNEDCKFFGGIVAINTGNLQDRKVFIKLHAKSEVNGFVYSGDYLHLEGQVNATVICNRLLLKTASAIYENHMLACEIDPKKYAGSLAVPAVFKRDIKLMCCEKMN